MPPGITFLGSIGAPGARVSSVFASARDLPGVFLTRAERGALHVVRVERDGGEHEVVTVSRGPNEGCNELAVSPDGRLLWLAFRGPDGLRAQVFRDGRPLVLPLPAARVHLSATWLGEGSRLSVSTEDGTCVIDVAVGVQLRSFPRGVEVGFSAQGDRCFLIERAERKARLSVDTFEALRHAAPMEAFDGSSFAFCPAGAVVWSLRVDGRNRRALLGCWDPACERQHEVDVDWRPGHACHYLLYPGPAPLTTYLECDCGEGARAAWDPSTHRISLHRYTRPHEGAPTDFHPPVPPAPPMRFRSRDRPLRCGRIARREDDLLCEWDPERGAWRGAFDFPDGAVRGVALSPDGRSVAFGRADGTARVAWVEDGTVRCDLEGHGGAVERCVRGRDGVTLYTVSNDGTLRGWDVARGVERLRAEIPREMYGEPCSCVLSEDGDVLTLAVGDSVVTYDLVRDRWGEPWGVGYSAFLQALRVGARGVQCHVHGDDASDPDQHMIAWLDLTQRTVSGEFSEPELQWLCANGRLFPGGSRAVVLARERDTRPDDTREASAIVDLDTGELLHLARRGPAFDDVTVVCAAVGARWVAAGYESEPRVTLWDARTGVLLPPIELPRFEHATAIALCEARAEVLVGTHGGRVLRYRLDGV